MSRMLQGSATTYPQTKGIAAMSTDLQVIESAVPEALSAPAIIAQVALIQDVMKKVMQPDVHYGVIPGTNKPTLLKPGAEKLMLTFRLDPQYESQEHFIGDHLFVRSKCTLYHSPTGRRLGSGEGSCSTKESKYAYRKGQRLCPECGKETIIKGKEQYGGGWLCWKKKDGCGAQWPDGTKEIEDQNTDRVANPDVADQYNTVLKMANKRSLIAAVLNVTAASDIFTQDVEDLPEFAQKNTDKVQGDGLESAGGGTARTIKHAETQKVQDAPAPLTGHEQAAFVWRITGKHKDESIRSIDSSYLDWFVQNGKRADHVEAATLELDRRRGQGDMLVHEYDGAADQT